MTLNNYSILLLKTNQNDIEWLQPMLLPHQITVVNGLSEAGSILYKKSIDAVILNLSFRNIQDFENIFSVYSLFPDTAIVAISDNDDEATLQKAIELGADEVVVINNTDSRYLKRILISAVERRKRAYSRNENNQKVRWRFLSEATFEGIMLHERGIILDVNHVLAEMTGYEFEELIGKDGFELVTLESQELIKQNIFGGDEKPYKVTVIRKDGSTFPAEIQAKTISSCSQNIRVAAIRDITERNLVEAASQERENLLKKQSNTLLELAKSKALIQGNIIDSVREITRAATIALNVEQIGVWLYGEDNFQMQSIDLYNYKYNSHSKTIILKQEDYPNYFAALEKGSYSVDNLSETNIAEELSKFYLSVFGVTSVLNVPIWLRGGVVGIVCYAYSDDNIHLYRQWNLEADNFASSIADFVTLAIEASERKAAQKALKQSEAQYKAIFERSSIGICLVDIKGRIVDINPALCKILKYGDNLSPPAVQLSLSKAALQDLIQKSFADYICFENGDVGLYKQLLQGKVERLEIERQLLDKNGGTVWTHLSISLIVRSNGKPKFFVAIIQEIGERKQTELQLRESKEAAELGSRAKSEFLATMSHELRTPLNAIMGLSQLLQQEIVGSMNDKQKEYIDCIYGSGVHLLELINDILDLSKIEAGKEELSLQPLQVENLCNYVISTVRERAEEKGLKLSCSIDRKADTCIADERRIKQMLLNLLSNAIKFTSKGKISLQVIKLPEGIAFRVCDTGIGIEPHQLKYLFEAFKQLDSRLNRQYDGTGLGLALTRKLARLHGGDVTVESKFEKGSCFTLFIPDSEFQEDKEIEKWEEKINNLNKAVVSRNAIKNKRILLVEDDKHTGTLLQDYLQTIGYQVEWVSNGKEFLEKVRIYQPNLILLDILLEDVSGLDLVASLRKTSDLQGKIVVVMTPSKDNHDSRSRFIQAGANDFVSKPIGIVKLESILMRYFH
ncbi:MAG: PAS domain S-box protein [Rivularia sp. (in: cyanobacteria)]